MAYTVTENSQAPKQSWDPLHPLYDLAHCSSATDFVYKDCIIG